MNGGIFISGPSASAMVYDREHIDPIIIALADATGDDPDEYTATDTTEPGDQ